jgi:hypothetical protein
VRVDPVEEAKGLDDAAVAQQKQDVAMINQEVPRHESREPGEITPTDEEKLRIQQVDAHKQSVLYDAIKNTVIDNLVDGNLTVDLAEKKDAKS